MGHPAKAIRNYVCGRRQKSCQRIRRKAELKHDRRAGIVTEAPICGASLAELERKLAEIQPIL